MNQLTWSLGNSHFFGLTRWWMWLRFDPRMGFMPGLPSVNTAWLSISRTCLPFSFRLGTHFGLAVCISECWFFECFLWFSLFVLSILWMIMFWTTLPLELSSRASPSFPWSMYCMGCPIIWFLLPILEAYVCMREAFYPSSLGMEWGLLWLGIGNCYLFPFSVGFEVRINFYTCYYWGTLALMRRVPCLDTEPELWLCCLSYVLVCMSSVSDRLLCLECVMVPCSVCVCFFCGVVGPVKVRG